MLASLKQQYVELLSDIGFIQSGLRLRDVERAGKQHNSDGVAEITGLEVSYSSYVTSIFFYISRHIMKY